MGKKTSTETKSSGDLLTAREGAFCRKLAALDKSLATKRAAALLALDEGIAQAEAADRAGLTIGQMRYLLTRFRQKRLAMFSDELLGKKQAQEKTAKEEVETKKKSKKPKQKKKKATKSKQKAKRAKTKDKQKKKSKKAKKKKRKTAKKKSKK